MKLTAGDLFTLFNRGCQAAGAHGYAGTFTQQSATTQKAFEEFKKQLEAYWPKDTSGLGGGSIEDTISRICNMLNEKEQKKLYVHLNALGHRIGR